MIQKDIQIKTLEKIITAKDNLSFEDFNV